MSVGEIRDQLSSSQAAPGFRFVHPGHKLLKYCPSPPRAPAVRDLPPGVSKIVVVARFRARVLPTEANGEQPVARMSASEIRGRHSSAQPAPGFHGACHRAGHFGPDPLVPSGLQTRSERREAERRQTQSIHWPHLRMRRASGGTRSPVGVPPRLLLRRPNATAQLRLRASWDAAATGVTRLEPVPVQRAPRRPVMVPAGRIPGAARGLRS